MSDRLAVLPQYLIPKRALTMFAGFVAGGQWGGVTQAIIRNFVAKYGVDMAEAANPDVTSYATFNDFFTRALKPEARPLTKADWVCPVDGAISQFGTIDKDQIFQAKGHHYSTRALVGGDAQLAAQFEDGHFACLYLSPKDYHRIHMPCDAKLVRMVYVPGDLFSVNPSTARGVPGLFARNERTVCVFDTPHGPFVNVLVGATIVGSMATTWHGVIKPNRALGPINPVDWHYDDADDHNPKLYFKQGDEMGRFLLGSTVVMLWPKMLLNFNLDWTPGKEIRFGEIMANLC